MRIKQIISREGESILNSNKELFNALPWKVSPEDMQARIAERKALEEKIENEGILQILKCSECGKEYEGVLKVLPSSEESVKMCVCAECDEEYKKRVADRREQARRESMITTKIPPRYKNLSETEYPQIQESNCSIIWGPFGTGKTWEAYSLCKTMYLNRSIKDFQIVTEVGLINELKAGFSDGSYNNRILDFKTIDLLVVDEVGKINSTDYNKSTLFDILNYRYDWLKKTVLICNAKEKEELFDIMPPATLDRFRECIIEIGGKSRRYSKWKQEHQ